MNMTAAAAPVPHAVATGERLSASAALAPCGPPCCERCSRTVPRLYLPCPSTRPRPGPGPGPGPWPAAPHRAAFRGPVVLAKGEVDLLCSAAAAEEEEGEEAEGAGAGGGGSGTAHAAPAPAAAARERPGSGEGAAAAGARGEPQPVLRCSEPGSLRRCGGQGDVLAGGFR
jgi:hypothetical protein